MRISDGIGNDVPDGAFEELRAQFVISRSGSRMHM